MKELIIQLIAVFIGITLLFWIIGFMIGFMVHPDEKNACVPQRLVTKTFLGWGYQLSCPRGE